MATWRTRAKMFRCAVEIAITSQCATVGGVTAKLNDLADYVDGGGKVGGGALFVQSGRKAGDVWRCWAIDFLSHLPEGAERQMLVRHYCGLTDYGRAISGPSQRFWRRVPGGLLRQGEGIVERMAA